MAAITTVADFLDIARKSQQVDATRIDAFLAGQGSVPAVPRKLAALLIRQGLLTAFQAEQFLLGKHKGFHLGGYRIIDRLGSGGAGTVYLAEHQMMKRRAAIKVLPTPLADDPAMLERFRVEAQAAAVLDHPNVVHLYDFRQEGSLYYLVMEYIDGPNLQQLLARKKALNVAGASEYARQAALGLQHAHDHALVHRDVKPANILVDSAGTIKVLDLGLARLERPDGESITRKFNGGAVLGTADYLAPEQALNLHEVDHRADVYSLGATLYALLTGQPPFHEGTIGQKLIWHQTREPLPVDAVRPEVPAELAEVVAKMLAKNPDDRYASMNAVAKALAPWADQLGSATGGPSTRTLAEIRLAGTGSGHGAGSTSRQLPQQPAGNTWVANAEEDTATIEPDAPPPRIAMLDLALGSENLSRKVVILGGLAAVVAGLVFGVIALLLWGPRP